MILPKEIINLILEYTGYKLRNGRYIKQLDKIKNIQISNLLTNMNLIVDGRVVLFLKKIKRKYWNDKLIVLYCHNYLHYYDLIDFPEEGVVPDCIYDFDYFNYLENNISYNKSLVKYTCGLYEQDFDGILHKICCYK